MKFVFKYLVQVFQTQSAYPFSWQKCRLPTVFDDIRLIPAPKNETVPRPHVYAVRGDCPLHIQYSHMIMCTYALFIGYIYTKYAHTYCIMYTYYTLYTYMAPFHINIHTNGQLTQRFVLYCTALLMYVCICMQSHTYVVLYMGTCVI